MKQRYTKRIVAVLMTLALIITGSSMSSLQASAASKKVTLKLSPAKASLKVGQKKTLKITKKNVKKIKSQKWTTSKKSVATVSKKGKVTAKKAGKATIKVKVKYIAKGSKKVKTKTLKSTVVVVKKKVAVTKAPVTTKAPTATKTPTATKAPTATPVATVTPDPEAVITGVPTEKDAVKYVYNDKSNIGEEKTVTLSDGTEIKSKDNGTVRENMSAQQLVATEMGMGINIGNTLEAIYGQSVKKSVAAKDYATVDRTWFDKGWDNAAITQEYLDTLHSYGINTVRIPVAWTNGDNDDGTYTINAKMLDRVEEVVNYALNNGMYVIINDHWDNGWWGQFGACKRDENNKKVANEEVRAKAWERYERYWTQIAERFKGYSDHLIFEGANEEIGDRLNDTIYSNGYSSPSVDGETGIGGNLKTAEKYEMANKINQTFVDVIRKTGGNNTHRHLLIPGYNTTFEKTVDERFVMPTDDANKDAKKLFVSVHYYTPWDFCGDGGNGDYTYGDRQATIDYFAQLQRFVDEGYGLIIGECGVCSPQTVTGSVTHWFNDTFKVCQQYSSVPVLWETGQYFDRANATLKFKDVAKYFNLINGANGDTSMTKNTGKSDSSGTVIEIGENKPVWEWNGTWYKNGGDYAYGPNRYAANADKTSAEDPDVATKMVPESNTTTTIEGDTTEITFDATGYQSFVKFDVSKYKNPAISVTFDDATLDPSNVKDEDVDNIGHIQLGVNSSAKFVDDVDIDYADFAGKIIKLKDAGLNLSEDNPYLTIAFSGRPTIKSIKIYDLGE